MPASAVPLTAVHCTRTRPFRGCERLMRNTAATELSVVTIEVESKEISLNAAGGVDGAGLTGAGTALDANTGDNSEEWLAAANCASAANDDSLPLIGISADRP